jgi:hypothetical protein
MVCGPLDLCLADGPSPQAGNLASIRLLETDSPTAALGIRPAGGGMK